MVGFMRLSILSFILLSLVSVSNLFAQSASVTFQVNMKYQIQKELFDETKEMVDVAGTFNNWGGTRLNLNDDSGDSIYVRTVTGFTIGQKIEFKFRLNGAWNGREEFPGGGNNRVFTIQTSTDTINVWYNDKKLPTGPPISAFSIPITDIKTGQQITFHNDSDGIIDSHLWHFEGGTPEYSNELEPQVLYNETGTFDVSLITSNTKGEADTLSFENYISVTEREKAETRWWNNRVFYEIFVRSFYDSNGDGIGDINGIIEKLDYLNDGDPNTTDDLGIGGIWLMPIHPSPSYHGYDVTDYRGVHPDYGTMDDFKRLVSEAHKRGIAIIIDYVMNHTSSDHYWFQQSANNNPAYRDYYVWSQTNPNFNGPWGQGVWHNRNSSYYYGVFWGGMPDLNYENPAVKDSIFNAASFWIKETGVDGFRLDAVKYIFEDGQVLEDLPKTHEFFADFSAHIKNDNPDVFTVGEAWTSTDKVLDYVIPDRIDYCFEFDVAGSILNSVNSGNNSSLSQAITNAYNSYPNQQFGLFLTNHDMDRVQNVLGSSVAKNKVASSLYLSFPGIPYIYYGEEIGMTGAKPDEFIRTPMLWSNSPNAGFTSGNPWIRVNTEYNGKNVALQENDENSLLNHYKKMVQLRNAHKEIQTGELYLFPTEDNRVFMYSRTSELGNLDSTLIFVVNLSAQNIEQTEFSPIGLVNHTVNYSMENLMNGEEVLVSAAESGKNVIPELSAYETKVLRVKSNSLSTEPVVKSQKFELQSAYPNPFNPSTTIRYELAKSGQVKLEIYDMLGRMVKLVRNENQSAGNYSLALDFNGFASGIYLIKLTQGSQIEIQKISLVK